MKYSAAGSRRRRRSILIGALLALPSFFVEGVTAVVTDVVLGWIE
jgi:hypothetical protein